MQRYLISVLICCSLTGPVHADDAAWVAEARQVATSVPPKLLAMLSTEIAKGGPEGAIAVCKEQAPRLAQEAAAASGWNIRRVSLRNRNPQAVPDAWERAALEEFDRRAAAGENPAALEKAELVTEEGRQMMRYMKALPTQELCLACHGPADKVTPAVSAQLKSLYPDDRAVGFAVGEIRGAMTIRKTR
ncbi:MAG: DUF3365 domain-containing protein [Gammaproteobacteria bacterium]|nr:DUF3365 domain-containing protein [Gammaproteobacteria bacterium]